MKQTYHLQPILYAVKQESEFVDNLLYTWHH